MTPFERRYRFSPDVVIRTPLEEAKLAADIFSANDAPSAVRALLRARPGLCTALYIASPSLWREVESWLDGGRALEPRAFMRVASYLVRAATRPTPFGFFAGLDVIDHTSSGAARLSGAEEQRFFARADAAWVAKIVGEMESDPARRLALPVVTSDAVYRDGERYRALDERGAEITSSGYFAYRSRSFKATAAVRFVLWTAREPVTLRALADLLVERSGAPQHRAQEILDGLWRAGAFLSLLRPTPFADPLAHVVAVGDEWGIADPVFAELRDFQRRIAALERFTPASVPLSPIRDLAAAMNELVPPSGGGIPIQFDVRRPAQGGLPPAVMETVGIMAEYALRASPMARPLAFRDAFVARFEGTTRREPLLALLEPGAGIEAEPIPVLPPAVASTPQRRLRDLMDRCVREGRDEVVIDPRDADTYLAPFPAQRELPDSLEIAFEVFAASAAALEAGDFLVAVGGFGVLNGAGRGVARFLRILPDAVTERLRTELTERGVAGSTDVELAYTPNLDRSLNVGVHPRLNDVMVPLGLPRSSERDVSVADVDLGIADGALTAYDRRSGKPLDIRYPHMLSMRNATPAARILAHLRYDRERFFPDYDVVGDGIRTAAYAPRIRIGRVIVRKAMWRLDLDPKSVDEAGVTAAADELRVPRLIYLVERDQKLFVDRSCALGLSLIVLDIKRAGFVLIEEAVEGDAAWLTDGNAGFRSELIARAYLRERYVPPALPQPSPVAVRRSFPPGSAWTSLKLYVPRLDQDDVLTRAVPELVTELRARGELAGWFFLRYGDARGPHLRLRLRASGTSGGDVLAFALRRAHEWIDAGIAGAVEAVTYEREIERYGGEYVDFAERLFERDSEDCASLLATAAAGDERLRACVLGAFPLMRAVLPGDEEFHRWARALSEEPRKLPAGLRALLRDVIRDADTGRAAFCADEAPEPTTASRGEIADALLHMRCNRLGLDGTDEARVRVLTRAAVVSGRARREAGVQT